jgi:hypothetical protein
MAKNIKKTTQVTLDADSIASIIAEATVGDFPSGTRASELEVSFKLKRATRDTSGYHQMQDPQPPVIWELESATVTKVG